jgi:DNA-binding GntR family transcriptional regulator
MYSSFIEGMESINRKAKMCVNTVELMQVPEDIAEELEISTDEKVICIHRYQKVDDMIISCIHSYLIYPLCEQAMDKEKFERESMYQVLAERPESTVGHVERRIYAKSADKFLAKKLNVDKGAPLLLVTNKGLSKQTNQVVIFEQVFYIGQKNVLVVEYEMGKDLF